MEQQRPISWIPTSMTLARARDKGLLVNEMLLTTASGQQPLSATSPKPPPGTLAKGDVTLTEDDLSEGTEETRTYELFAAVFHVRDAKSCGSLVAIIKVGWCDPLGKRRVVLLRFVFI